MIYYLFNSLINLIFYYYLFVFIFYFIIVFSILLYYKVTNFNIIYNYNEHFYIK